LTGGEKMTKDNNKETAESLDQTENQEVRETACADDEVSQTAGETAGQEQEQLKREIEETKDRMLRLHADFDNYRKRMNREKEEWVKYAAQGLIEKLLPVMDNFELALATITQHDETGNLSSGVAMIQRQLKEVLEREGLTPINAVDEIFDPQLHEAIMQVQTEAGQADNQIVEELRKGYRFKEKVIRPSMVKVAKNNEGPKEE
jgi:molecular chaperone GrpE